MKNYIKLLVLLCLSFSPKYVFSQEDDTLRVKENLSQYEEFPDDDEVYNRTIGKLKEWIRGQEKDISSNSVAEDNDRDKCKSKHKKYTKYVNKYKIGKANDSENYNDKPIISIEEGLTKFFGKNYLGEFSNLNTAEIKLGWKDQYVIKNVVKHSESGWLLSYTSNSLGKDAQKNKYDYEIWRGGYYYSSSYGYKFGGFQIVPYVKNIYDLSQLKIKNINQSFPDSTDYYKYDRYKGNLRFGRSSQIGIDIQPFEGLSIGASYQRNLIYPRLIFWQAFISEIAEFGAVAITDGFISDNPYNARPIFKILLQGGLSFVMSHLRTDNMNWPYHSERPMAFDDYKINLTFTF